LIKSSNQGISIARQADLLNVSRSSLYYEPVVDPEEVKIMNAIDEIFTARPFYGHRRIRDDLVDDYGIRIGKKRTSSLMKKMGLQAFYPKKRPNTSAPNEYHKKFPYLLKNLIITKPDQVWGTDITYIRTKDGFVYLTSIIDWFSRYVVAWKLSQTLENDFCIESREEAIKINIKNINNSDQGVQYTSEDYVKVLEEVKVKISMDGRGRCMDNIFTERLWRTVRWENIYLNEYRDIHEVNQGLTDYFRFYNEKRKHTSLDKKVPAQIYFKKI
jgi:putative transposase